MNRRMRIAFTDWWAGFDVADNFVAEALAGKIEYDIVQDPGKTDFVFCSVFGKNFLQYKCPRVLFTGENYFPDFNIYDYAIGFENFQLDDRYHRFPLYAACYADNFRLAENRDRISPELCNRDFCSIVVSNKQYADDHREDLFERIALYKPVASGGKYRNNIGMPEGVPNKNEFLKKYKFSIACENVSYPGYCTEKLVDAFAADTVPIYWGDPMVEEYFNPKAFINCSRFSTMDECVEFIKELDLDNDRYLEMLRQPIIINDTYSLQNMTAEFRRWLLSVVSQNPASAYRRCQHGYSMYLESCYSEYDLLKKQQMKHRDRSNRIKATIKKPLVKVKHLIEGRK